MFRRIAIQPGAIRWWVAAAFIGFAMLFGGGARADIMSLIWLRPVAFLVLAYAAYTVPRAALLEHRFLLAMGGAVIALTALHLVPLPPGAWHALPGRTLVVQIDDAVGVGEVWRPLTMTPTSTWNALFSLAVPLATLLLVLPMNSAQQAGLLKVILAMLALTALVGLMQATGAPLKFFDISNPNAGLFANRNHQAVMLACVYPVLAVMVAEHGISPLQRRMRWVIAVALGLILAPLLMVTGSRAGIVAAVLAILAIPAIVSIKWRSVDGKRVSAPVLAGATAAVLLVAGFAWVAAQSDRNLAFLRFTQLNATEDLRFPAWQATWALVEKYFPFGSGIGSFVEVFQIDEPASLLATQYWNHAHNDWLEVLLVAGIPGAILLALAVAGWAAASLRAFTSGKSRGLTNTLARLGCFLIGILGLASVFDYPIRTPAVSCVFAFAAILAANGAKARVRTNN